jgi:hypothetical protein
LIGPTGAGRCPTRRGSRLWQLSRLHSCRDPPCYNLTGPNSVGRCPTHRESPRWNPACPRNSQDPPNCSSFCRTRAGNCRQHKGSGLSPPRCLRRSRETPEYMRFGRCLAGNCPGCRLVAGFPSLGKVHSARQEPNYRMSRPNLSGRSPRRTLSGLSQQWCLHSIRAELGCIPRRQNWAERCRQRRRPG